MIIQIKSRSKMEISSANHSPLGGFTAGNSGPTRGPTRVQFVEFVTRVGSELGAPAVNHPPGRRSNYSRVGVRKSDLYKYTSHFLLPSYLPPLLRHYVIVCQHLCILLV